MAARGVYFFQILRGGGIFKIFPARGVYPPTPSYSRPLVETFRHIDCTQLCKNECQSTIYTVLERSYEVLKLSNHQSY